MRQIDDLMLKTFRRTWLSTACRPKARVPMSNSHMDCIRSADQSFFYLPSDVD